MRVREEAVLKCGAFVYAAFTRDIAIDQRINLIEGRVPELSVR